MTDDIRADAGPATPARRPALRRYALSGAQALVLLLLLDGFVDVAYPTVRAVVLAARPSERSPDWAGYRARVVPGLGALVEPVAREGLNVDALGRRSTGNSPRNGAHGVLLGSSQAFGHHVADDATIGAAIERQRPDVSLSVIAGPARTTAESMVNWQRVAEKIDAPDFVIFLFSNVELFMACKPQEANTPPRHEPALLSVPARALRRISTEGTRFPCSTPEARAAVVERSLYELRAAVAYGRARNPHFAVAIAPLVYGNDSNAASQRRKFHADQIKSLDMAVRAFRARIAAENIPGVIDLSDVFDGKGDSYFIDRASHFNREGADLLAARMLERLPKDFSRMLAAPAVAARSASKSP